VGIVVDNGQMVNALNEDADIIVSDPFSAYFAPRYLGARRLFG
jgi:cell wall-associated NlpC family hydrolase